MRHVIKITISTPLATCGLLLLLALNSGLAQGENLPVTIPNTERHTLHSQHTDKDHELIVLLPGSYHNTKSQRYPVLYLLDGYWDIGLLASITGNLNFDQAIPEMIIIGLSYTGKKPDYGSLRRSDFTPTSIGTQTKTSGGAAAFLQYIKKEATPFIDKRFRTDQSQRILAGHSLGGLFCLFTLFQSDSDFFDKFIALSPAVVWDNEFLFSVEQQFAKQPTLTNTPLYIAYGGDEFDVFARPIPRFIKQLQHHKYKQLSLKAERLADLRHSGVKSVAYTNALTWLFKDYAKSHRSGLEAEMASEDRALQGKIPPKKPK